MSYFSLIIVNKNKFYIQTLLTKRLLRREMCFLSKTRNIRNHQLHSWVYDNKQWHLSIIHAFFENFNLFKLPCTVLIVRFNFSEIRLIQNK